MVLVHYTLSHCALEVYEVSTKYVALKVFKFIERTNIAFSELYEKKHATECALQMS